MNLTIWTLWSSAAAQVFGSGCFPSLFSVGGAALDKKKLIRRKKNREARSPEVQGGLIFCLSSDEYAKALIALKGEKCPNADFQVRFSFLGTWFLFSLGEEGRGGRSREVGTSGCRIQIGASKSMKILQSISRRWGQLEFFFLPATA